MRKVTRIGIISHKDARMMVRAVGRKMAKCAREYERRAYVT
jgi:hypothetical protein